MTDEAFRAFLLLIMECDEAHGLALPFIYAVPDQVHEVLTDALRQQIADALRRDIVGYFKTWDEFVRGHAS